MAVVWAVGGDRAEAKAGRPVSETTAAVPGGRGARRLGRGCLQWGQSDVDRSGIYLKGRAHRT